MITILKTFTIVEGALLLWLLYALIFTKPTFTKPKNVIQRIKANWSEGGKIMFHITLRAATVITAIVVVIILVGKIIDKL